MIVKMSKVELVGPKGLLQDTLGLVRELGIFQIEPASVKYAGTELGEDIRAFCPDERTVVERLFLEELLLKIDELASLLPKVLARTSYIDPHSVVDAIAKTADRHISKE